MMEENDEIIHQLDEILKGLIKNNSNIHKTKIITQEGLTVPNRPFQLDDELVTLAAMGAVILSAGELVGQALKKGMWTRMIIRGGLETVILIPVGENFALVVLAASSFEFKSLSFNEIGQSFQTLDKHKIDELDTIPMKTNLISKGKRVYEELKFGEFEGFQFNFENDDYYVILKGAGKKANFYFVPISYFNFDFVEQFLGSSDLQKVIKKIYKLLE